MSLIIMNDQEWKLAIRDHLESGRSITASATKYECSYSTFHKKLRELRPEARITVEFGHTPELVSVR